MAAGYPQRLPCSFAISFRPRNIQANNFGAKGSKTEKGPFRHEIARVLARPAILLFKSPILIALTIYISICCGYIYIVITEIAPIFEEVYGFSEGASGLAFLGLCQCHSLSM